MNRRTRKPAIPPARTGNAAVDRMLDALREQALRWRGDNGPIEDKVVTFGDLQDSGIGEILPGDRLGDGTLTPPEDPGSRPGPLTNLQANGAFENVILDWEGTNQRNYAFTEIHRATVDDLGQAVLKGTSIAPVFADSDVDSGQTYYYWVRAISTTDNAGPFNATAGTKATVAVNPQFLANELTNQITETQLFSDLNSRINLIDGPASLTGSVNARVNTEKIERQSADSALASDITTVESSVSDNASAIQNEQTTRANEDNALASDITTVQSVAESKNVTFRQSTTPTAEAVGDLWVDTSDDNKLHRWNGTSWVTADDQRIATNSAAIQSEATTRADEDSALASDITTVQGNVGSNSAAIQERVRINVDGSTATAQYDVRLETTVDGQLVMGGFGLASDGSTVQAGFNVDRFWIGQPSVDYTQENKVFPFIVDSGRVVIDEAFIRDGTITNAKINTLAADKLFAASGTIADATIGTGDIGRAMIDTAAIGTAEIDNAAITNAKINTAAVDTLEIKGDAVTVPTSAITFSGVTLTTSWQDVIVDFATFDKDGFLYVSFTSFHNYNGWSGSEEEMFVVNNDNGSETKIAESGSGDTGHIAVALSGGTPITAGVTYKIGVRMRKARFQTSNRIDTKSRSLFYMLAKR